MTVTFWLDGEAWSVEIAFLPNSGDRLLLFWRRRERSQLHAVVAERWWGGDPSTGDRLGWHIVLRRPETPAERTPPWERGKETP